MQAQGMEKTGSEVLNGSQPLPAAPERVDPAKRVMITRPGFGRIGNHIELEANHFKVSVNSPDEILYHYNVSISYEDKRAVENKWLGRKIIDRLCGTHSVAYDGEKALYTVVPLPRNRQVFPFVLGGSIARRSLSDSKSYMVEINYVAKIPLKSVLLALSGAETEKVQDALRVLDIILRQTAANRGCLLLRQPFTDVGGGVSGYRGFHSSFRPTHGGLSLNIDVSTTMVLTPGPVIEFLKVNQSTQDDRAIDWAKAKKMLKNVIVKATHINREFKIIGLSEKPCNELYFTLKKRHGNGPRAEVQPEEITVYEYFTKHRNLQLTTSAYFPCLDVGKPGKPNYVPLELCNVVSLERYTKALSPVQRAFLVNNAGHKPLETKKVLTDSMDKYGYDKVPLLSTCGISIEKQLTKIDARVLETPKLKVGGDEDCIPCNGRWNFNKKRLMKTITIKHWLVVNFSAGCDISRLSQDLTNCGKNKGIVIECPYTLIEEEHLYREASPQVRVDKMFDQIIAKVPEPSQHLQLILCVLPEKKKSDIYGPWKRKCLIDSGIATQCVSPPNNFNDQYLTNVLLKINSKLGGTNSLLAIEAAACIPVIKNTPTMILGLDIIHGSAGRLDAPSIAAVVGSHTWPLISRYRAAVRTQSSKAKMIESLFKPSSNGVDDDGIMRELLNEFEKTNGRNPSQIVVFRDGVSESQFNQIINNELGQMKKAYEYRSGGNLPKFTLIVAQKNHRTKLFRAGSTNDTVPPGTVVDTNIVHPINYDFYLCSQAGVIGTARPAHYHVLVDEIGFSPDDLQNLIHSLSYVYQRSTTAISMVAPVYYARLAATQVSKIMKFDESTDACSGNGSYKCLPRLHNRIAGSMFFC
ncbi:protein argonaute 16-like [Apium graveolens]|uniref:protein argonaute 16-like n=1 Tax=Apium graveolens TaxID=4045 RepID=UPI003D79BD8D